MLLYHVEVERTSRRVEEEKMRVRKCLRTGNFVVYSGVWIQFVEHIYIYTWWIALGYASVANAFHKIKNKLFSAFSRESELVFDSMELQFHYKHSRNDVKWASALGFRRKFNASCDRILHKIVFFSFSPIWWPKVPQHIVCAASANAIPSVYTVKHCIDDEKSSSTGNYCHVTHWQWQQQ